MRDLAPGAAVNVNTVRAVYRRLEAEGLAATRPGHGTFVADHPGVSPALEQLAGETAESAAALGVDLRELAATLYVAGGAELSRAPSFDEDYKPTEEEERAARRALRAQIASLERQLGSYPESTAEPAAKPRVFPAVKTLSELEQIRDQLAERLSVATRNAEKRGRRQDAARARLEDMAANPAAHRGEIVSSEDLGEPGCASWEVAPAWGPIGALMDWWRVKISSGCP